MNTPLQNLIAVTVLFGPLILIVTWITWYKVTGRAAAARQRKRDREIETQIRLGMADEAAIQRVAYKILNEEK